MLSKKTKYGLKALIYLARHYEKGPMLISDLAKFEGIPKKFLELILLDLKNHGFLHSKRGKGGGYYLRKSPEHIIVGDVVRLFDGPLAPVSCVSQTAYQKCAECKDEHHCEIRMIMKEVRDAMSKILDQTSLSALLKKSNKSLHEVLNFSI